MGVVSRQNGVLKIPYAPSKVHLVLKITMEIVS